MSYSFAYAQSDYEIPIGADAQVLINGIDARSFGAELTSFPDIALPGTRQQSIDLIDRNYAQYARDLYTGFNFDLTFQVVGNTPTDLNQKITDFLSFIANEKPQRNSSRIESIIVEFPALYIVSDEGTVSYTNATITGTGTRFQDFGTTGDLIKFAGDPDKYYIKTISSNTSLVLYTVPTGSGTNKAYNLYRRRYLKASYSGSSSHSSPMSAPLLRDTLSTSRKPIVRDVTISFYTDEPYWVGTSRSQDISISGGGSGTDYNFHLINGVGDAGFHPRITIPTTQDLDVPKIYKVRHNFLSNFDGNGKYKDIANELKTSTSASGDRELIETRNESVVGNGSLYVAGGSAKFNSTRFKAGSRSTRLEHTSINYSQGHLSTWVKVDFAESSSSHYIIDFGSNNNRNLSIYYDASNQNVVAKIGNSTATVSKTLSNNSFYNIQAYWVTDNSFLSIYVREYGSSTDISNIGSYTNVTTAYPNEYVFVGSNYNGLQSFNGLIDEIVIWEKRLTSDEVDSLGGGANPKSISPQHIKTHIGTTGDVGTTGVDYVSCDDNEIYEISSITRNTAGTLDNFTIVIPEIDVSGNFETIVSESPTVTIYDEFSGERGNFKVTTESHSNPNTTLTVIPFEDSVNMTHTYTNEVQGNMPSPDEIGVHALMNGVTASNITGGNWYANGGSSKVQVPTADRDDIAISAWVKIDSTELAAIPDNELPSVGTTTNDKAYIFESFNNALDDGWGLGIDDDGKPVFTTHKLAAASNQIQYATENVTINTAAIHAPGQTLITYTNTSPSGWHQVELASYTITPSTTSVFTIQTYAYEGGNLIGTLHSFNVSIQGGTTYSRQIPLSTVPILIENETFEIKINVVDKNDNNDDVTARGLINYTTIGALTKEVHDQSSQPSISDGEWHHVAVIYEDTTDTEDIYYDSSSNFAGERLVSGKINFYVDGVVYGTSGIIPRLSFGVNANNVVGRYPSVGYNPFKAPNGTNFPGSIRDVRLYAGNDITAGYFDDKFFVNRLMCANGNSVIFTGTGGSAARERHWWKFMDRPDATYIIDKGFYGNPSHLYMKGASYQSDYSSNGRTQNVLLSKSYFCDPTLSKMPSIGAFRVYNETDKYDSTKESGFSDATYDWAIVENNTSPNVYPDIGDKMLRMGAKTHSSYPLSGLSLFIPRGETTTQGITLSGYYWKSDAQTGSSKPLIQVDSIDMSGSPDFGIASTITTFFADDTNLDEWIYFEIPFSEWSSDNSINAITFLQPNDTGNHYFSGISIRQNHADSSSFDVSSQVAQASKIWSSDTDTTIAHNTNSYRTGTGSLTVSANDDSQGVVYQPASGLAPTLYHNDFAHNASSSYYLSIYAKKVDSGTGNIIVSALGLNGAGTDSGSVQYVGEIPVTDTGYTNMTEFLKLPAYSPTYKDFVLTFKDSSSFLVDGITLRSRIDLPYTKTSSTASGGTPSYIFADRDLGVSLTNKSLLYYNNVIGMKSQGSAIIRIKSNVDTVASNIDNMIANSGGERYGSWNSTTGVYSSSTDNSSSGAASIQSSNGVYQNVIGLKAGKSYTVKMDILASSTTTVTFGTHAIDVNNGTSDTSSITSTIFTRTVQAGIGWQTVLETVNGTDANYLLRVSGSFYLDNVSVVEADESAFDSVLFSWHADDSGNPDNDDFLRLAYSSYTGFVLQRNNSGSLETVAIADVSYDSNTSLEIALNWDEDPKSDEFTGDKNYGTIVINGTSVGLGKTPITSTTGVYKHLIVGCQGGYSASVTGTMHVDATIDGLLLSNRLMSIEELIETYKAQEQLRSSNDIISLPDMTNSTNFFVYSNGQGYSSTDSNTHLESIKNNQTASTNARNYGLNDNDKVVLYSKFGSTPNTSFDIKLDHEPRYR